MLIISSFTFVLPSCLPTGGSSHPIRLLKGRKVAMTFLKKYWTFQRAIDAYDPAETSVFPYKSFGTVPLFWRVRTQLFLWCKRPFSHVTSQHPTLGKCSAVHEEIGIHLIKVCHENWPLQVVNKLSLSTMMKNISSAVVGTYCLEISIAEQRLKICRWLSHSPHIFEVFLGFSTIVGSWLFHIWSLFVKFSSWGFSAAIFVSEVQQSIESP